MLIRAANALGVKIPYTTDPNRDQSNHNSATTNLNTDAQTLNNNKQFPKKAPSGKNLHPAEKIHPEQLKIIKQFSDFKN